MTKLLQLPEPCGNWVLPGDVIAVTAHATPHPMPNCEVQARVEVKVPGAIHYIVCEDYAAAAALRDKIANDVNAAREGVKARHLAPGEGP